MSLGVVVKGPEGIALAADSRVTLFAQKGENETWPVHFDNATKLMSFTSESSNGAHSHVGVVTYGQAVIGLRTAHSYLPEIEANVLGDNRLTIREYAERIQEFYSEQWKAQPETEQREQPGPSMTFIVSGYNSDEAYGRVYLFKVPGKGDIQEQNPGSDNFGMTWGGQLEVASRIVHGYDPRLIGILKEHFALTDDDLADLRNKIMPHLEYQIPYPVLPLQDCVDLASFIIETTMRAQRLSVDMSGVGGLIEVATITRGRGFQFVRQKTLRAPDQSTKE